jgi:hypothetical protein
MIKRLFFCAMFFAFAISALAQQDRVTTGQPRLALLPKVRTSQPTSGGGEAAGNSSSAVSAPTSSSTATIITQPAPSVASTASAQRPLRVYFKIDASRTDRAEIRTYLTKVVQARNPDVVVKYVTDPSRADITYDLDYAYATKRGEREESEVNQAFNEVLQEGARQAQHQANKKAGALSSVTAIGAQVLIGIFTRDPRRPGEDALKTTAHVTKYKGKEEYVDDGEISLRFDMERTGGFYRKPEQVRLVDGKGYDKVVYLKNVNLLPADELLQEDPALYYSLVAVAAVILENQL